jgi:hypothetical protein
MRRLIVLAVLMLAVIGLCGCRFSDAEQQAIWDCEHKPTELQRLACERKLQQAHEQKQFQAMPF